MLPEGFHWDDGPAPRLLLDGHVIAVTAELPPGYGWRIDQNPNRTMRHSVFVRDRAAAIRYLEAWARKWELRLREEYGA